MREVETQLERDGFAIVRGVLSPERTRVLAAALEASPTLATIRTRAGISYGSRNALEVPEVRELLATDELRALVAPILGPDAGPVRGLVFDKVAGANWKVPWHQDVAIAVAERRDVPGFTGWSTKAGVPHVHAPACVLETMLAVRLHLDDCAEESGPLRVAPGSHRLGKLSREEIGRAVEERGEVVCSVSRGDALLMRPLLLHASSPATRPSRRRVLHVELAEGHLPGGLRWDASS